MTKRLIDANKLEDEFGCSDRDIYAKEYIREAPTVFEFPENPTNGDIIKALFPNLICNEGRKVPICFNLYSEERLEITGVATIDWWDAPYRKKSEVKEDGN